MLIGSLPVKDVVWGSSSPSSSKAAAMIRAQKKGDDDGEKEEKRGEKGERAVKGLTKLGSGKRRKEGAKGRRFIGEKRRKARERAPD